MDKKVRYLFILYNILHIALWCSVWIDRHRADVTCSEDARHSLNDEAYQQYLACTVDNTSLLSEYVSCYCLDQTKENK